MNEKRPFSPIFYHSQQLHYIAVILAAQNKTWKGENNPSFIYEYFTFGFYALTDTILIRGNHTGAFSANS